MVSFRLGFSSAVLVDRACVAECIVIPSLIEENAALRHFGCDP